MRAVLARAVLALVFALVSVTAFAATEPQPFLRGSWQALRTAHAGRPTIVHFWGLTCGPCLVELPEWGKFAHEREDLDVVTVAADPVAVAPADLAAALAKAGLSGTENWHFADRFGERLEYEIDPTWRGELPLTILIDRDGATKSILGPVDFAALAAWSDGKPR
jgi:thiol-disulfide isomerase/thioredoxin